MRFGQPHIDQRVHAFDQFAVNRHRLRVDKQIGPVRTQCWRQRTGYQHLMRSSIGTGTGQFGGQAGQGHALRVKALLADMKRHDRVAIGRQHLRAAVGKSIVRLAHKLRPLHQRQGRPFGLLKRGAYALEFTAHAAI